jgi:hypothetical protein
MSDKSPRQTASKKSGKSLKAKRADKKAAAAPSGSAEKATGTQSAGSKKK